MLRRSWIAAAAFCAAMALPALAAAQTVAYSAGDGYTNLREGPSTRYRVIARLYPGTRVDVLGCLESRSWCEVIVEDIQGWVYARRLEFVYAGRRVFVPDYYSYFGAPFVIFRFGDYDRRHRHDGDRDRDRFYGKEILGHPGGGGPGPVDIPPIGTEAVPPDKEILGHPGGGGPGPENIGPEGGFQTDQVPGGVGPDGSGSGGGGVCPPGDPSCIEGTQ